LFSRIIRTRSKTGAMVGSMKIFDALVRSPFSVDTSFCLQSCQSRIAISSVHHTFRVAPVAFKVVIAFFYISRNFIFVSDISSRGQCDIFLHFSWIYSFVIYDLLYFVISYQFWCIDVSRFLTQHDCRKTRKYANMMQISSFAITSKHSYSLSHRTIWIYTNFSTSLQRHDSSILKLTITWKKNCSRILA